MFLHPSWLAGFLPSTVRRQFSHRFRVDLHSDSIGLEICEVGEGLRSFSRSVKISVVPTISLQFPNYSKTADTVDGSEI